MPTPRADTYTAASGATVRAGRSTLPPIPGGTIVTFSLNTLADIDPQADPLANPNHPSRPPWDVIGGLAWAHTMDYTSPIFAADMGTAGALMQWCATGHSANGATCWAALDVASRNWSIQGHRPLPSANLQGYSAGVTPPTSQFDHTWGDFIGGSADWPAGFAQPGYNPPAGGHLRASMTYRPATQAGNVAGEILMGCAYTGVGSSTGITGSHVYDCEAALFSRSANSRRAAGSAAGNKVYDAITDITYGWDYVSSSYANVVNVYDWSTDTWSQKAMGGTKPYLQVDGAQAFICGGLLVVAECNGGATFGLFAARLSDINGGGAANWQALTISASAWPVNGSGACASLAFQHCPDNGAFYCIDRITGSHSLYKLTPPGPDDAGNLSGTWTLDAETLAGDGLVGSQWQYNRLQWSPALHAFLFQGDSVSAATQAVRPIGV